jgi:hypothetical protein
MSHEFLRKCLLVAAMAAVSLNLIGCADNLSGTYVDPEGLSLQSLEFRSGHKVYVTMFGGAIVEATYHQDGDKVILETKGGDLVLTVKKDGSLSSGNGLMGATLKKKGPPQSVSGAERGGVFAALNNLFRSSASSITGVGDPEAVNAVRAELELHWLRTPDGWTSEYAANGVVLQFKELTFDIKADPLTAIGKQMYEFHGGGHIASSASRYYAAAHDRSGPRRWTEWSTADPEIFFIVTKEKGRWIMNGGYDKHLHDSGIGDLKLFGGTKPDESTLSRL